MAKIDMSGWPFCPQQRTAYTQLDVADSREQPLQPWLQVEFIELETDGPRPGYAYLTHKISLSTALHFIDNIGGADSSRGPRLIVDPR